ncbi:UDP-N-acetylglucosamine acyltransferase [Tepidicaulis marinus]|jgi:UDP-N-acetylglucosamine acyltransferase|uniref:Acyl-[acyl-carrier-protein]--UDP-N-acetylglucosamine O-acyltransferase n=1 Tax=Tepidicaulis marinus TaxID=1333998 RepID=A0A081B912_9HYPH|nr:acyl-ACP--UDP-N-acetylglucosamine O-acyltransferase [Tepidicaulis marinus]GAK44530.1 UDP-N-acetylglucosamine acyltransferase [Tepidicaulis marinus]
MSDIHPTAIIDGNASIGADVKIGPYCLVGPHVSLGDGVELLSHVVVEGHTSIGPRTKIFPFAVIGHQPQDLKYKGEASRLEIGSDNLIREHVTMNPGTEGGGMVTRVGNHNAFLTGAHVGHDCIIGDHVVFSNAVLLAGHCLISDYVILGGGVAVHQFTRIGAHAFVGGASAIENDVIPYGMALGNRAHLAGLNVIGLRRRGFSRDEIHALRGAYKMLFAEEKTLRERLEQVAETYKDVGAVQEIVAFIKGDTNRSLCTPRHEAA